MVICTSNACLKTRSPLSRRNDVSELSANNLFVQFQKAKKHTLGVPFGFFISEKFWSIEKELGYLSVEKNQFTGLYMTVRLIELILD